MMTIIRAQALGMCFGVREAIATAMTLPDPAGVIIHGELVHNEEVLHRLAARGFIQHDESDRSSVMDSAGAPSPRVMITAHGISDHERARLAAAGHELIDTTCPLVRRAHAAALALAAEGRFVIVIGKRGHVEVEGLTGDLEHYTVVARPEEVETYPADRLGVLCQTTTAPAIAQRVLDEIRTRNPGRDIRYTPTICRPTFDRQAAIRVLLDQVEAVVVVGGRRSNNTLELVRQAETHGRPCRHVQTVADLADPAWFAGFTTVGLTAGTSTPDWVIDAIEQRLREIAGELAEFAPPLRETA